MRSVAAARQISGFEPPSEADHEPVFRGRYRRDNYVIEKWGVAGAGQLARQCADLDCEAMFEPSEWNCVYAVLDKEIPQSETPRLDEVIRAIASLNGFADRPNQEPGTQTLWVGLQRCHDMSNAWNTFGPGAKNFCPE